MAQARPPPRVTRSAVPLPLARSRCSLCLREPSGWLLLLPVAWAREAATSPPGAPDLLPLSSARTHLHADADAAIQARAACLPALRVPGARSAIRQWPRSRGITRAESLRSLAFTCSSAMPPSTLSIFRCMPPPRPPAYPGRTAPIRPWNALQGGPATGEMRSTSLPSVTGGRRTCPKQSPPSSCPPAAPRNLPPPTTDSRAARISPSSPSWAIAPVIGLLCF